MTDPYEGQLEISPPGRGPWCVTRDRLHEWRLQMDLGTWTDLGGEHPEAVVSGVYYCVHCLRFRYVHRKEVRA